MTFRVTSLLRKDHLRLALVAAVLGGAMLVVRGHEQAIGGFIDRHAFLGLFLYLSLNVVDALVAPGATLPLIPVASRAWGRAPAALATTAGWTAGSLVAFMIARRWGYPVVQRLTSMKRVRNLRRFIPKNLFWSIVLVRLILPMDVISYALGLLADIRLWEYLLATALGLTPSAFVLSYLGELPHAYELIALAVAGFLLLSSLLFKRFRRRRLPTLH